MNFFESQLRRLFGDTEDARFIGRCCFIPADDGNLVKAEFVTQGVHEEYVALQMSVINRADGIIDKTLLRFGDYFSRNSRGQTPHIWCDSGKHEWYGPPPQTKDWNALRDAAFDYMEPIRIDILANALRTRIELLDDIVQTQSGGQTML